MAEPVAPSLLDRILDRTPELSADPPTSRPQQLRDARAALRRDLQSLLNTRFAPHTPPPRLRELRSSLLGYGVPDFIGSSMIGRDQRQAFARQLEAAIRTFEPRLMNVAVTVMENRNPAERLLRLRIEAVAVLHEGTLPTMFAFALDPSTMRFHAGDDQ